MIQKLVTGDSEHSEQLQQKLLLITTTNSICTFDLTLAQSLINKKNYNEKKNKSARFKKHYCHR